MELRDYQLKAISLLKEAFLRGYKRPILRLDTGAGKTAIASYIALNMAKQGKKMLFLTHLQEIEEQTILTLKEFNVDMNFVDVGMIITISHHLENYNPDLIICDECNFALSKTWQKVLDHFSNTYVIGLSASPVRLSGEPMGDVFDTIIDFICADDLIKLGYLSEYDLYAPKLNYSVENAKRNGGDFDQDEMEKIINDHKLYGDILGYFKKYANDKKTICYCTNIKHSKETAQMFLEAGYKVEHIDGTFSRTKRREIIERFRKGETQILTNCNLISFGFDCPSCDCVVGLRPTTSLCLYIQAYGRALRKNGENRAVILDFAANVYRFGMPTEKRKWTLEGKKKCVNINAEPEVFARECKFCLKTYAGQGRICPYCKADNGKTKKQIEQDNKAELERVSKLEKQQKKQEQAQCKSYEELLELAKKRNYKNPSYWAMKVWQGRRKW